MAIKLSTFRMEEEDWKAFQEKAKANGTDASALLRDFVRAYLDGSISGLDPADPTPAADLDERIAAKLETAIAPLQRQIEAQQQRVASLEAELGKSAA